MAKQRPFKWDDVIRFPPEEGILVESGPFEGKRVTWKEEGPGIWPKTSEGGKSFGELSGESQAYLLQRYANHLNEHLSPNIKQEGTGFFINEVGPSENTKPMQMVVYYPTNKNDPTADIQYRPIDKSVKH